MKLSKVKEGTVVKLNGTRMVVIQRIPDDRSSGETKLVTESGTLYEFWWDVNDPEVEVLGLGKISIIFDKKCTCHERDSGFTCDYCKETDGHWGHIEDTETSIRWCEIFKVQIMDADGWADGLSITTPIHIYDFARRIVSSTCRLPLDSKLQAVIKRKNYAYSS